MQAAVAQSAAVAPGAQDQADSDAGCIGTRSGEVCYRRDMIEAVYSGWGDPA
jgi:hypothetical protein